MKNLFMILEESVTFHGDKTYIVDKGQKFTYLQVFGMAHAVAEHLVQRGIKAGDRVLLLHENSVEYVAAFFACPLANAIAVPVNKNVTTENLAFILQDSTPAAAITNHRLLGKLKDNQVDVVVDMDTLSLEDFTGECLTEGLASDPDLPAMLLYTSGTTRMPKGVALTHGNLIANTEGILQYLELSCMDSVLATMDFSYSYGNSVLLTHTRVGGTVFIDNRAAFPMTILETLQQSRVTGFSTVGSYLTLLLKQQGIRKAQLEHLRYITFAGESTSMQDIIKLKNLASHLRIFVMYGQTEATARLSYLEPSMLFRKAGSIGKGMSGVELRVIDEAGKRIQPGEIGEIIATGAGIMMGYWNNQDETDEVLCNGWLHTGDLATVDKDGYIYVKGRKDDVIKYLGHRISPLEIEDAINSCDLVMESAVIGIGKDSGKRIKAYVILQPDCAELADVTDRIHEHVRRLLPAFKRPQVIEVVQELPRTTNGKLKRAELRRFEELK